MTILQATISHHLTQHAFEVSSEVTQQVNEACVFEDEPTRNYFAGISWFIGSSYQQMK
jgi:hypothetical protein